MNRIAATVLALTALTAAAQYPTKPIKLIVPAPSTKRSAASAMSGTFTAAEAIVAHEGRQREESPWLFRG